MTATEKYHAVLEGKLSEAEFVRQMRQSFPQFISQWNGFKDSVSILKNRQMIFEKKETPKKDITALADNFPLNVIERGIDIELETSGIDSTGSVSKDDYIKAKHKVISNLQKDANHYINLMSGESNKVDKHDKMKETKRGAKDADTFNAMKKATLKEDVDPTLDPYEDKKEIVRQVIDLVKREKSVPTSVAVDFIKTHYEDIINLRDDQAILDEFDEFASVNYEAPSDFMQEREVEEAMDDATMDAIKSYKPGSMDERPHEYKPGDMFSTDFDYEGMLKAGLKVRINTPIETMQAIYDSFEDVNYHRENRFLGAVIDAVEAGNKDEALEALRGFRKEIKNTLGDIAEGVFPIRERDESYVPKRRGTLGEKKGKDHDGDGDIDGDDYMAAKDKAIKSTTREAIGGPDHQKLEDLGYSAGEKALMSIDDKIFNHENFDSFVSGFMKGFQDNMEASQDFDMRGIKEISIHDPIGYRKSKPNPKDKIFTKKFVRSGEYDIFKNGKKIHTTTGGEGYANAYINKLQRELMGKDEQIKEAVKSIIKKVLTENTLNEAATNELARFADEYAGFQGMKGAILDLQNIVSDIEAYYDKTRDKIQKIYDTLGEIRNEEGLKVGGFLAPAIESAFIKDLRPVTKQGFTKGLDQPKVRVISQKDIDAHNSGERPLGETDQAPKQSVFTPNI